MPLILPQLHGRRFTFSCDAMRAGTWHYPYTSTSHGLRSGCKVSINILMFQTFGYFFHFLHSFFYILDNIRYKFTRILTLTIQQGLFRDTINPQGVNHRTTIILRLSRNIVNQTAEENFFHSENLKTLYIPTFLYNILCINGLMNV